MALTGVLCLQKVRLQGVFEGMSLTEVIGPIGVQQLGFRSWTKLA